MDEIRILHEDCKGTAFELPFLLAVWLGLRTSEIRGLTWDCLDGDILTIKQAMVDGEDGPQLKQPKTYSGNRKLKVPPYIMGLFAASPRTDELLSTQPEMSCISICNARAPAAESSRSASTTSAM